MKKEVNLALSQIEVTPGHPDSNVRAMLKETEKAKKRRVDMIVFPEMVVPGYLLGDDWENDGFISDLMEYNQGILAASTDIAIVWGNIQADPTKVNEDGRTRKYNAVHVAQYGEWVDNGVFKGHSYKTLLPEYREFDDPRHYFSLIKLAEEQGKSLNDLLKPFPIKIGDETVMMGAILCEDMWCDDYAFNPTEILVKNGAEFIVNISCSPWTWRKNDKRHRVVRSLLEKTPIPFAYINNVGTQNNGKNIFLFEGGTTVYNPDGSLMLMAEPYTEETVDAKIGGEKTQEVEPVKLSAEQDLKELYDGLIYAIKGFFTGLNKKAVIGVSGGIDSAVSCCLLVDALGKENVMAVNMPSKFNSELTRSAALQLAENLGIEYKVFPIQESVDLTIKELKEAGFTPTSLDIENIQARDRGSRVLAGIAACTNSVFTNNGNKTEVGLGYCTLYGDVNGAIAPIADLYKGEVYALARYINSKHGQEIIPDSILNVVPSAELSVEQDVTKGQGDPIKYPYHDKLVRAFVEFKLDPVQILTLYKNGQLEETLKIEEGLVAKYFPDAQDFIKDLEEKWELFKGSYFKRVQAPPIIAVSRRAFGFDDRETLNPLRKPYYVKRYKKLKEKILGS